MMARVPRQGAENLAVRQTNAQEYDDESLYMHKHDRGEARKEALRGAYRISNTTLREKSHGKHLIGGYCLHQIRTKSPSGEEPHKANSWGSIDWSHQCVS